MTLQKKERNYMVVYGSDFMMSFIVAVDGVNSLGKNISSFLPVFYSS